MSTSSASSLRPTALGPHLRGSYALDVAALTLEAMRLGVVPSADLTAYTVGRLVELELVDADLVLADVRGGAVRAFLGDYGSGKTHLLELIQGRALSSGFLTARVTLDPRETAPSHPKRVYRALVRSLLYPDRPAGEGDGLWPLLQRAAGSEDVAERLQLDRPTGRPLGDRLSEGAHLYLTPALQAVRSLGAQPSRGRSTSAARSAARELLVDWLEGHPTLSNRLINQVLSRTLGSHDIIYSLKDYRPWARIYGYLLSGLSWLARQVGYHGLVLVVDEAEFYALLSKDNRDYAQTVFKALTFAAVGEGSGGGRGADLDQGIPFDVSDLNRGGYGILKALPPAYHDQSGLYVVFAMTPNPDGMAALQGAVPADRTHEITPLARGDYIELASLVCDFYVSSRPDWSAPEAVVRPLGKVVAGLIASGLIENPRQAMKFVIEFLDLVRFRPERVGDVVQSLSERVRF